MPAAAGVGVAVGGVEVGIEVALIGLVFAVNLWSLARLCKRYVAAIAEGGGFGATPPLLVLRHASTFAIVYVACTVAHPVSVALATGAMVLAVTAGGLQQPLVAEEA